MKDLVFVVYFEILIDILLLFRYIILSYYIFVYVLYNSFLKRKVERKGRRGKS